MAVVKLEAVTTNVLGGANYLKPNSLMQPRLIGIGGQVKW